MYNKVEISGVNTTTIKVLSKKEKEELLALVQNGDKEARNKLVNGNLKLVLSVVQRFSMRGEEMDDLFQVGCIGLIKAIENFDSSHGVQLSTYAVPMIIGEIRRHLRDSNSIRVSRSVRDIAYKSMQAKERLLYSLGREPTIDEISAELSIERELIVYAIEAISEPVSLNEPVYNDNGDCTFIMDQVSDKVSEIDWIESISFKESLKRLTKREREILKTRFIDGKTQVDAAQKIGISQAQVSRVEKGIIEKIKRG